MSQHRHRRRLVTSGQLFDRLWRAFGPQQWWPARTAFEVMVGAILTQATSWHNVEQAIDRLRQANALTPRRLLALSPRVLERCIRPSGAFRQKAKRLRALTRWYLGRYRGQPSRMFRVPPDALRRELLQQHGIGPETADTILLYAGGQPVFVVDAYTRRVFRRHRLVRGTPSDERLKLLVRRHLAPEAQRYNEFHALLVAVGKRYCHRRAPDCTHCPLGNLPRTLERTVL